MNDEERQQFQEMRQELDDLKQLFDDVLGGKPERIGQVIVKQRTDGSVSVGGTIRVVTTEGEVDILTT